MKFGQTNSNNVADPVDIREGCACGFILHLLAQKINGK